MRRLARALLALACLAAVAWTGSVGPHVLAGLHPATAVLLAVVGLLGLVLLLTALTDRPSRTQRLESPERPERPGEAGTGRSRTRRVLARTGTVLGSFLVLLLAAATAWLRPSPATDAPLAQGVTLTQTATEIVLRPSSGTPTSGLVLQPGARVDPHAYTHLASRLAAEGHEVVIVKQPLQIAFLATGAASRVMDAHPEVSTWAVGGHSLGGVVAAGQTDDERVAGLLLWASYPTADLAGRDDLAVTSVSGSADALATPAAIDGARHLLPASTRYVVVEGGVHAFFGDYGPQAGDGTATTSRSAAQDTIVTASEELLDSLVP